VIHFEVKKKYIYIAIKNKYVLDNDGYPKGGRNCGSHGKEGAEPPFGVSQLEPEGPIPSGNLGCS